MILGWLLLQGLVNTEVYLGFYCYSLFWLFPPWWFGQCFEAESGTSSVELMTLRPASETARLDGVNLPSATDIAMV